MPWKVFKSGEEFCIHKLERGDAMGERVACHATESEADAQLKALYASEAQATKEIPTAAPAEGFAVHKQADGKYRWIAFTSSSYKDAAGQIVSQKALEADSDRMNASGQFGTLDWWHLDGTFDPQAGQFRPTLLLGECDFSAMHGRISVESGTYFDNALGAAMQKEAPNLEISRSFFHPRSEPDAEGVFHSIRTNSRAVLPRGKAANQFTRLFVAQEEVEMTFKEKVEDLITRLGGGPEAEKTVQAVMDAAQKEHDRGEQENVAHKEDMPAMEAAAAEPAAEDASEALTLEGLAQKIDALATVVDALTQAVAALNTSDQTQMALTQKETGDRQAALDALKADHALTQKALTDATAKVGALEKRLKALEGEQAPANLQKLRASQSDATLTTKEFNAPNVTAPNAGQAGLAQTLSTILQMGGTPTT